MKHGKDRQVKILLFIILILLEAFCLWLPIQSFINDKIIAGVILVIFNFGFIVPLIIWTLRHNLTRRK